MTSLLDLDFSLLTEDISEDDLRQSIDQFLSRKNKIKQKKLGPQHSWLMCAVPPIKLDGQEDRNDWAKGQLTSLVRHMPNNAYRLMVANAIKSLEDERSEGDGFLLQFNVEEGLQVVLFQALGLVAFRNPPGSLKLELERNGFPCEWNWAVGSVLSEETPNTRFPANRQQIKQKEVVDLQELRDVFGEGKGATLAIIDSGICPKSIECANRIKFQAELVPSTETFTLRETDGEFSPVSDHGTVVASLAAGSSLGIARHAEIVSLVLPIRQNKKFDQFALYASIEYIATEHGLAFNGVPLREKIDTILIPAGVLLDKKLSPDFRDRGIRQLLLKLHEDHDICIVAAVGNSPGRLAFPSSFQFVCAVGALNSDGTRSASSGYGKDTTGQPMPNISVIGEALRGEGRNQTGHIKSGSSFSAALVGGAFTALAEKNKSSSSRWGFVNSKLRRATDDVGHLNILDLSREMSDK
jgi:hypothetical protein